MIQPYNFQPYAPQAQPFQQMQQFQQPFQNVQQFQPVNTITTKTVNTFDEITANDVPMNAPYAVFIKSDLSEIQLRRWNGNGQIETSSFDAKTNDLRAKFAENPQNEELKSEILTLSEKIDEIKKLLSPKEAKK